MPIHFITLTCFREDELVDNDVAHIDLIPRQLLQYSTVADQDSAKSRTGSNVAGCTV
jgi:hypothetical protein